MNFVFLLVALTVVALKVDALDVDAAVQLNPGHSAKRLPKISPASPNANVLSRQRRQTQGPSLDAVMAIIRSILEAVWPRLGPIWERLGPILRNLGPTLVQLFSNVGPSQAQAQPAVKPTLWG